MKVKLSKEDKSIVQRIRDGDRGTLRDFFDRKSVYLRKVSKSLEPVLPDDEVEDVIRDTLLKVVEAIQVGNYEDRGQLNAFLVRSFANAWSNASRAHQRMMRGRNSYAQERAQLTISLDREIELRDITDLILKSLPPKERQMAEMRAYDYTHKEIADELGITEDASKKRWERLVKRLRRLSGLLPIVKSIID